jgi:tetratricopeptide (TPR) repeat protein
MSFIAPDDATTNQNLDQLDQSFMYTQLLKEILLTIDFEQKHIDDFISYCREQFAKNTMELKNIDKFEREYYQHDPIWWYTYPCFLYSMLNRALRMMEVDLIITMGFFVRQLHQRMVQLHLIQYTGHNHSKSFTVYRGQGLSQTDFDQLMKTKGGLLSFNNFLSTSADRQESLKFSRETIRTSNLVGILFIMKIDPSVSSIPFADVRDISYCHKEQEILFSTHSIFRIREIKKLEENGRLWEVELTLTSDNDSQLEALTERIREETFKGYKGWYRLGYLLIKLGQFDKSEQLYDIMLDKTTDDDHEERLFIYHMLAMVKDNQGKYAEAITFYKKSIEIKQIILSPTDLSLASSYNNIGLVYEKMKKYSKALSSHTKALCIREKFLPPIHLDLAQSYACHGSVYDSMGEYSIALSYYDKAHEIYQKVLLENHSDLATSYDNIGKVFSKISEYSKALSCQQTALDIRQKVLPIYHPILATSYYNIGSVFSRMGDDEKALPFYERALDIGKRSLAANHPHLRLYKNKVEKIKSKSELLCFRL